GLIAGGPEDLPCPIAVFLMSLLPFFRAIAAIENFFADGFSQMEGRGPQGFPVGIEERLRAFEKSATVVRDALRPGGGNVHSEVLLRVFHDERNFGGRR